MYSRKASLAAMAGFVVHSVFLPSLVHSSSASFDPVVITASRTAEHVSTSLAAVTLITREDIERLQPRDLQDLLTGLPGISIASNGGPGKSSSIFLRGTESDHVLMLIDGVRFGSATSGSPSISDIPVDHIERIEIVRGPRSSLYGSDALGGVIQIFTRRGGPGAAVPSLLLGGGNHGSARAELGLRGSVGNGWYGIGLAGRSTDGIDVRPSLNEPDNDGYRNLSGSLRGGWRFDNGAELSASWLRAQGENEFDGASQNETESTIQVLGTHFSFSPLARWKLKLSAGQSRDHADNLLNGEFVSNFDTTREHYSLQNDLRLARGHMLIVGADFLRDEVDSTTPYPVRSRENTAGFAQYQARLGVHELQVSARHDDNEQFGSKVTGGLAWGYRFGTGLRLTTSWGTAFKAPTFNELYFPNFGNPDLEPEESRSAEIALRGLLADVRWGVSVFRTEIDELIAYDASIQAPSNIDEAVIRGVELDAGTQLGDWRISTWMTWLDPENRSAGANNGNVLPRRAQRTARIDVDRDVGLYSLGATLFAAGRRFDNIANSQRLGGYSTLALRAAYRLSPAWWLQAEAQNLLDKDYETARTYSLPGRTWFLSVRYAPEI
jgi:vitamin B12 transporter